MTWFYPTRSFFEGCLMKSGEGCIKSDGSSSGDCSEKSLTSYRLCTKRAIHYTHRVDHHGDESPCLRICQYIFVVSFKTRHLNAVLSSPPNRCLQIIRYRQILCRDQRIHITAPPFPNQNYVSNSGIDTGIVKAIQHR
jgi:hypothetical protein